MVCAALLFRTGFYIEKNFLTMLKNLHYFRRRRQIFLYMENGGEPRRTGVAGKANRAGTSRKIEVPDKAEGAREAKQNIRTPGKARKPKQPKPS